MIGRALLCGMVLPLAVVAQIQVFLFDGTNESAVGTLVEVGTATPGDTLVARFRVRNIGNAPQVLSHLSLSGDGFTISAEPSLPYTLAPYDGPASEAEFDVAFSPTIVGSYSAFLAVNTVNVILQGTSAADASVLAAGSHTPLSAGNVVDFGAVTVGSSHALAFTLLNGGTASTTVETLAVSGTGFRGPINLSAPVQLTPGQSASFQVAFEPKTGQPAQGTLTVDKRSFVLAGQGSVPPLPAASIVLASARGVSSEQDSLSIPLASASQVSGTGTLTLAFQPSVAGVTDDPTVQFVNSNNKRTATVTVSAGDSAAKFGGESSIDFQTGTTAGTITFMLTLGSASPQKATLTIPAAPVLFDTASGVRRYGDLDVSLTGFDNTYSAAQMAFTFYDLKGAALPPGAMLVNAGSSFQKYFAATQTGGSFSLLAQFPVTGDVAQIGSVDVQITNSAGTTTVQHIAFGN